MNETKCFICEPDGAEYRNHCSLCKKLFWRSNEYRTWVKTDVPFSDLGLYYGRFVTRIWTEVFFTPGT